MVWDACLPAKKKGSQSRDQETLLEIRDTRQALVNPVRNLITLSLCGCIHIWSVAAAEYSSRGGEDLGANTIYFRPGTTSIGEVANLLLPMLLT